MYTDRWGLLKHYAYILRTGDKMYGIQMSFPVEEQDAETAALPTELVELNKKVKIKDQ